MISCKCIGSDQLIQLIVIIIIPRQLHGLPSNTGFSIMSCRLVPNDFVQALFAFAQVVFGLTRPEEYCYTSATSCK